MSRTRILERLESASSGSKTGTSGVSAHISRKLLSEKERVARFRRQWEMLGGTYEEYDSEISARLAILLFLRENNVKQLLSWEPDQLVVSGLGEAFADAGIVVTEPERRSLDPIISLGMTSVDAALADTGSLILVPDTGRSWLPALLPIRHYVILPASRIYSNLDHWRESWTASARLNDLDLSLIITGPSYSTDIELHPHLGMFGPRMMHLFLIRGI